MIWGQDYKILNAAKEEITFNQMIDGLLDKDIILFGEFHDNASIHQLQEETYKQLIKSKPWAIGMEMLERHQNRFLQEFMHHSMSYDTWLSQDQLWPNFTTDYLPLLQLAKTHRLPAVATNIPRYLASTIARNGWDSLNTYLNNHPEKKQWIAPLPLEVDYQAPGYREFPEMFGGNAGHGMDIQLLTDAQAIKDATMAESILKFLARHPKMSLFHIQGNFHNKDKSGIIWYLKHYKSPYNYSSIEVYRAKEAFKVDINTAADYYIIILEE